MTKNSAKNKTNTKPSSIFLFAGGKLPDGDLMVLSSPLNYFFFRLRKHLFRKERIQKKKNYYMMNMMMPVSIKFNEKHNYEMEKK